VYGEINIKHICYSILESHSRHRANNRLKKAQSNGGDIRKDDDSNIVLTRLKTYKEQTEPMLHLLAQEKRLLVIKSSGTIEDIRERTKRALGILSPTPEGQRNPCKESI